MANNSNFNSTLMDNLKVDVQMSRDLKRLLEHNAEIAPKAIMKGLRNITKEGSKQVKAQIKADGLVKSGRYVKSVVGVTNKNKSFIGTKSRIANILESGAKAHSEAPKKKKAMKIGGDVYFFTKKVNHPSLRAYDPFKTAWDRMEGSGQVQSLFSRGVWDAINEVNYGG